jgi:hypothetical protein
LRLRLKDDLNRSHRPITVDDTFVANFLEECCESTPFEYDYVLEDDLDENYRKFEVAHQCTRGRYPLKESLLAALGHRLANIPLRVVMHSGKDMDEKKLETQERKFKERVKSSGIAEVLREMGRKKLPVVKIDEKEFRLATTVVIPLVVNILVFMLLPLPLLVVAFLYQQEAQALTLDKDRFFTFKDLALGPDPTASSWPNSFIAYQNWVLFYGAVTYYFCLLLAYCFYMLETFEILPNANLKVIRAFRRRDAIQRGTKIPESVGVKGSRGWRVFLSFVGFRFFFQWLFKVMVALVCAAIMGYVGLVLVWASLAAIINPTRFLAYTSGVLGSVSLVAGRLKGITSSRDGFRKQVCRIAHEDLLWQTGSCLADNC